MTPIQYQIKALISDSVNYVRRVEDQELDIEWDAEGIKINIEKLILPTICYILSRANTHLDLTGWTKNAITLTIFYKDS
ncbi:MAG TPA: hypothetical protein VKC54_01925 [Patescibacteria group bacterium]|nr:hypothetical protein [Patescibacteria group bacterium]